MAFSLKLLAGLLALAPTVACGVETVSGDPSAPLVLERTIPLKAVRGRIDHLAIDLQHRRLFIAELGNGSVEAIDLARGVSLGRIGGLMEPQGLAYLPAEDELAVASGGDGSVRFYRASDLKPGDVVMLGSDADDMRVDVSGRIVVGYGSGALAVISPVRHKVVARLDLPAHPEGFQLQASRAFVNLPDAKQIAVGDLASGRITATWPAAHLWNFPMGLEAKSRTLATVYRGPARLQLLDTQSGAIKLDHKTCEDADDVFFDGPRNRAYVICGTGAVDVVDLIHPGQSVRVVTRLGARTGIFVPELGRLFVAARAGRDDAAILVYRPQP